MPISREYVLEIARRLATKAPLEELARRLAPVPESERPFPPDVPRPSDGSAVGRDRRLEFLRERGVEVPHLAGTAGSPDPESLRGSIEQFIGMAQVPVGLIGPLRVNGLHAHGDFYVPLATSEGALVASYHRGARLVTRAGGVSCLTTVEQVQRAPAFVFENVAQAGLFAAWAAGEIDAFRAAAATRSSHATLIDVQIHLETRTVYLVFVYRTGDAAGQNMVTACTEVICHDIVARTPIPPRQWFVESNLSGDKKATVLSFQSSRGRKVIAEVVLPRELVERGLHTSPEKMCDYWRLSFIGGVQSGSIGVSGHIANGIAALFLACGQDVACVAEATVGITRLEMTPTGDLYCGVDLPNLIVGTVGGGTRLPTASDCLRILECQGEGCATKFAEICAATVLAGEISIIGAISAGDFARAHRELGRPAAP